MNLINKYAEVIPRFEIEELLAYLFNCDKTDLYTKDLPVDREIELLFDSLVLKRLAGEPLQYIIGRTDFMGLDFRVQTGVFIPRPETELLVANALSAISCQLSQKTSVRILDLCTGSGCIAISLAKNIPAAEIIAIDISERALDTARENAVIHNVAERIKFYKGDLFEGLVFDKKDKFDIIVCNPPYIKNSDIGLLQLEVRQEPESALGGGTDGLEFYRQVSDHAPRYLKQGCSIFLEIGADQFQDVKDIFRTKSFYCLKGVKEDFAGIKRVIWIDLL
ncbi:MAG: peptide chain release factor N(5)-glutamine methyltransferase [Candidatus Omnitrophota bacterium]